MTHQLRLPLRRPVGRARADYVAGVGNADALRALDSWPHWSEGKLALVGPEGAGKTHLAQAWALAADAVILDRDTPDLAIAAGRPVLVEDVDRGIDSEALFHLINLAAHPGGGLLLTARSPPRAWVTDLPDLRSRLNALPVAEIGPPDDVVLRGVLEKFFRERNILPPPDVSSYLLWRIERSVPAAYDVVKRLDKLADEERREISRALARRVLGDEPKELDLFGE